MPNYGRLGYSFPLLTNFRFRFLLLAQWSYDSHNKNYIVYSG